MRATVSVLVAAVLVLGGCSGDSSSGPVGTLPTSEPTATESALPTEEPTPEITMPVVEAPDDSPMYAEFSEEAALEFLDYFWDVYSYFNATRNFAAWDGVSDPECIFCADIRQEVEDFPGYLHDVIVELSDINVVSIEPNIGLVIVEMLLTESLASHFDVDGAFIRMTSGDSTGITPRVYLLHEQGQWKVAEVA